MIQCKELKNVCLSRSRGLLRTTVTTMSLIHSRAREIYLKQKKRYAFYDIVLDRTPNISFVSFVCAKSHTLAIEFEQNSRI